MKTNEKMVEKLKQRGYLESETVENAFRAFDRKFFVPGEESKPYVDRPQPIGKGQTISAPHMVARNTELLELEDSSRVLEIGSGSGYQLAILSELAEKVTGIEIESDLSERSRETLGNLGVENVDIINGNGLEAVDGSFDRILYSCAIPPEEFEKAREYLKEKGIIVAPVKETSGQVLKRYHKGKIEEFTRVRFVEFRD